MRSVVLTFAGIVLLSAAKLTAQTPFDIQPIKELKPTGTLGTCDYQPTAAEAPFLKNTPEGERINDPLFHGKYSLRGKSGVSIAWFGVVRGVKTSADPGGETTLLVQHHFFDGMTDCHIMLVGIGGMGDFTARLKLDPAQIPGLSLVRIYGKVKSEKGGVPEVEVDYIRVWPWLTFTFTDLSGGDQSNPRWQQYSHLRPGGRVYAPYPNRNYYLNVLGDPAEFGLNLREQ
jgi:hypothetical protein